MIAVAWYWRGFAGMIRATVHLQGKDNTTLCGISYQAHWFFDISKDDDAFTCKRCKRIKQKPVLS
jgi:hypothetical protein